MKTTMMIMLAACVVAAAATSYSSQEQQFLWEAFRVEHKKSYPSAFEAMHRYNIFKENLEVMRAHNEDKSQSYKMGVNQFSDLTRSEFASAMTGGYRKRSGVRRAAAVATLKHSGSDSVRGSASVAKAVSSAVGVPASVDWVEQGAVTGVKNQGQCGACWAFSTTGSVEGAHAISTGSLVSLSEQQLIDCSSSYGNNGCNGGEMDDAFQYVEAAGGLASEQAYPYTASDGQCDVSGLYAAATISSYQDVTGYDEDALQQAVAQQPVSVAIQANQQAFQMYSGGVFDAQCGTQLDHGVLVVGYGTSEETGQAYWLVKNSWGPSWGENGYIRLARGTGSGNPGQCGVAIQPSYPIV